MTDNRFSQQEKALYPLNPTSTHWVRLICHPTTPALGISEITVEIQRSSKHLRCRYTIRGSVSDLAWTDASPGRSDDLWRHTCCELFAKGEGANYRELNFAPSGQWAAYWFDRYRERAADADMPPPVISIETGDGWLILTADMEFDGTVSAFGLAAVIEMRGGSKSYWALAHPLNKPDFHHVDCFALKLTAAGEP